MPAFDAFALGVVLAVGSDPSRVQLDWRAPRGCTSAEHIRAEVGSRASRDARPITVRGRISDLPNGREWALELELRTPDGTDRRVLISEECEGLGRAAAFLIVEATHPVVTVDTSMAAEVPEVEPVAQVPAPPPRVHTGSSPELTPKASSPELAPKPSSPELTPKPSSADRPSTHRAPWVLMRAEAMAQVTRILPAIGGGTGAALGLQGGRARAELRGHYFFTQRAQHPERPDVGGSIDLWVLSPAGCWVPGVRVFMLPLCGGVEIGAMRGRGDGMLAESQRATRVYAATSFDLALISSPWRSLGFFLGARALVVMRRPGFYIDGLSTELFRASPVGLRLVAGIELRYP